MSEGTTRPKASILTVALDAPVSPVMATVSLRRHNADIKKRAVIAKEVHKAVEMGSKEWPPEERDEMLDAIAGLFLSRIGDIKEEEFTKAFYTNLLSSMTPAKKT